MGGGDCIYSGEKIAKIKLKYIKLMIKRTDMKPYRLIMLLAVCCSLCSCENPIEGEEENPAGVSGYVNGFAYVDLGLSVKWASCNVGAYAPDDYGNYYAWGETVVKAEYTLENSVTFNVDIDSIGGDPAYDVATVRYGAPWRLPTRAEVEELVANCDYKWESIHGIVGGRLTSRINGNSIFLPGAGHRSMDDLCNLTYGYYWTSDALGLECAATIGMSNTTIIPSVAYRHYGCNVRPVVE